MKTIEEALEIILNEAFSYNKEIIRLEDSIGRILAESVYADRDYPPFNRSAMDGFAVKYEDLDKNESLEVIEEIHAGYLPQKTITCGTCASIMTGAPLPEGADTVIRIEDATIDKEINRVTFVITGINKGANISFQGEDFRKQSLVINRSAIIDMNVIGTLSSLGKEMVEVYCEPKVTVISTGTELKPLGTTVEPYQIRDSNSYSIQAFLEFYKIKIQYRYLVADNYNLLKSKIYQGINSDILIISGGVSAGVADYIPQILLELGARNLFHKVKIKPGKPLWFGKKDNCKIFALPGNPFSVQVALKIFIEPFIRKSFTLPTSKSIRIPISNNRKKKTTLDEFHPCTISNEGGVDINKFNGSGDIGAILFSDGLVKLNSEKTEFIAGDMVEFYPWRSFN